MATPPPPPTQASKVKALYSYERQTNTELSFNEGDILKVTDKNPEYEGVSFSSFHLNGTVTNLLFVPSRLLLFYLKVLPFWTKRTVPSLFSCFCDFFSFWKFFVDICPSFKFCSFFYYFFFEMVLFFLFCLVFFFSQFLFFFSLFGLPLKFLALNVFCRLVVWWDIRWRTRILSFFLRWSLYSCTWLYWKNWKCKKIKNDWKFDSTIVSKWWRVKKIPFFLKTIIFHENCFLFFFFFFSFFALVFFFIPLFPLFFAFFLLFSFIFIFFIFFFSHFFLDSLMMQLKHWMKTTQHYKPQSMHLLQLFCQVKLRIKREKKTLLANRKST